MVAPSLSLAAGPKRGTWPRVSFRRLRAWLYQALFAGLIIAAGFAIARNVQGNLALRGLTLDFSFLNREAGFAISFSAIPYTEASSYGRVFLVGLTNTLLVAVLAIPLATLLGFLIGVARLSANAAVARFALVYVEVIRNLPALLHVLIWYNVALRALPGPRQAWSLFGATFLSNRGLTFPSPVMDASGAYLVASAAFVAAAVWFVRRRGGGGATRARSARAVDCTIVAILFAMAFWQADAGISVPHLSGFNFEGGATLDPEIVALVIALSVYNAAFIAELVRSSILSVDKGQREAALALGLDRRRILRLVVMPQALRLLVPPLAGQYLHLLKASSLGALIGFPELINVFASTSLNQTGRAVEIILMTMAVYLVLSAAISLAASMFEAGAKWKTR